MALFKCKMCGGDLEITPGVTVAECEYCGTKQTLPKANEEVIQNLFNRATALRLRCEFDKAEQIYEKILQEDDSESEAHWGIVLCKYGIEYVEDPKTYKRIPTCHRTSYDAVTTDADYLAAVEHADPLQRSIYEAEAKAIDDIQRNILSIVKDEKPFDVFICYKETDENGKRTIDSTIANDIYYQLTQEGLKVFYAAITLEDKLGQEYEPYIFAALNSAKVMLVIGTKPQYFSAVWVKNEWSRFLKLMKSDRNKLLIPCYKDMDAYELPEEFAHLQAQDMSKIGFINDVVRGIRKIAVKEEPKATVIKETVVTGGNTNTAPLLRRAFLFLEDGDWDSADEYCEKVLDVDPENAQAYLGKLMSELHARKQEDLKNCADSFDSSNNYQKTVRFGDDKLKVNLSGYIEHINTRNENERLAGIYDRANDAMSTASKETAYIEAAHIFETISDYKDSAALAQDCYQKAEIARKDAIYYSAKLLVNNSVSHLENAIAGFRKIPGWKDADEQIAVCQQKIQEINAKEKADRIERIEKQKRLAEIFRKETEKRAKRNKRIAIITTTIVCAVIAFVIVLNAAIIPAKKKNDFIATYGQEIYDKFGLIEEGTYISFGTYEQNNNTYNGEEDIEWLVLEIKDGKALVISKYALDCKQYNTSYTYATWEACTLRKWMNDDFINSAFSAEERAMIPTVTVSAGRNEEYSTDPGNETRDKVFLLSMEEINTYLANKAYVTECKPTKYAVANGAGSSANGNCSWWLRPTGYDQTYAAYVDGYGTVKEISETVSNFITSAVRPAMWIDLKG